MIVSYAASRKASKGDSADGPALEADPALTYASDVGAGADSKPAEPWDPADALSRHPRTYFSPHVGGYTDVSYANTARLVAETEALEKEVAESSGKKADMTRQHELKVEALDKHLPPDPPPAEEKEEKEKP